MTRRNGEPVHGWLVLDKPVGAGSTRTDAATTDDGRVASAGRCPVGSWRGRNTDPDSVM